MALDYRGELVTQEALRKALDGGATYASLVEKVRSEPAAPKPGKSTVAKRKADLKKAIANSDRKVLARLRAGMRKYVSSMADVEMIEPRELTPAESQALMSEHVSYQEIHEFLDTRRDTIRALVFAAIAEQNRAAGVDDPEGTNGFIPVPELGKKFCKEGAGYQPPQIDRSTLAMLLGEDAERVFVTEEVPATTRTVLDEEALGKLIMDKPEVLEHLRSSLIPGKAKSARFVVRDYAAESD